MSKIVTTSQAYLRNMVLLAIVLVLPGSTNCAKDSRCSEDGSCTEGTSTSSDLDCKKACENVARITLEDLDNRVKAKVVDSETSSHMTPEKAQRIYASVKKSCIKTCEDYGTSKKTACYKKASNMEEVGACK
jgi:hypothetical protein